MTEMNDRRELALFGEGAVVVEVLPQANPFDLNDAWKTAFFNWLNAPKRCNANTRRAYEKAWWLLLDFTGKMPWQITKSDVASWVTAMHLSGLSAGTIAQRVAAVSSFFNYAMYEAPRTHPDGRETGLCEYNPAGGESIRPEICPYDKAVGLTLEQCLALLRAIVPNTVQGLRDSVLFRLYIATGRRNSEIRTLQKKDIRIVREGLVQFYWNQKHGQGWDDLPWDLWEELLRYLEAAGRPFDGLANEDYIFTALSEAGRRLPQKVGMVYNPTAQPLAARTVGGLLKRYARKAGLDPKQIHVHTLRHTTADMMLDAGWKIEDVQRRLGHANIGTTQIYVTNRVKGQNKFWAQFKALNDL